MRKYVGERIKKLREAAAKGPAFNGLLANMVNFASMRAAPGTKFLLAVRAETGGTMMFFGLFHATPTGDDDIATRPCRVRDRPSKHFGIGCD